MIRTTSPQLIDAQNQISAIVYFDMGPAHHDRKNGIRRFTITSFVEAQDENGDTVKVPIKENIAIYKEATFLSLWGTYTLADFEINVDQFMIDQIEYINSYTWDGTEAQDPVRFWNLASSDLEIVPES